VAHGVVGAATDVGRCTAKARYPATLLGRADEVIE